VIRLFVSAGEPSGDAHAAAVVRALHREHADLDVEGIGGPQMAAAGARLLGNIEHLSVMGLSEGIATLPAHARLLRIFRQRIAAHAYDAVLLVDYPGFHLVLARAAASHGVPVVYYIAPQMWAWGPWRVAALRSHVRHLAVILPFEEAFFEQHDIPATFVGHPLLDRKPGPDRAAAREALGISYDAPALAMFPGSRESERRRLWPVFRDAAHRLRQTSTDLELIVAAEVSGNGIRSADAVTAMAAADVCLCKSGTTTLEAALSDTPMVVAYRMSSFTFAIARRVIRVPHVSLVNLVAGREVVPELLQDDASPETLVQAILPLLDHDGQAERRQRDGLAAVRERLGSPGAAQRVAELTLSCAA
jgi:lipid-A-disaccharide synthase